MTEHTKEADQAKEGTQQEGRAEEQGVSTNVVLGAGIGVLHWPNSDEEEKLKEKQWHQQRAKDEAQARNDARKADSNYEPSDGQPYVPKMPFPVPKDWDWRRVKREEEERRKGKGAGDCGEPASEGESRGEELVEKEKEVSETSSRVDRPKVWGRDPDKFDEDEMKYGEPGYEWGY